MRDQDGETSDKTGVTALSGSARGKSNDVLAAIDLGTNNCRLLIAERKGASFTVIDAFSRIVRLGEGVSKTGALSDAAISRTLNALRICAEKIQARDVNHIRCIATQACRSAANGDKFLRDVRSKTGLEIEIISAQEEARLAVCGCADLFDAKNYKAGLVFDIGGGSTELSWLSLSPSGEKVEGWASLPFGVVSLSEKWGGDQFMSREKYSSIVAALKTEIEKLGDPAGLREHFEKGRAHFVGTSGTVTCIAGVHLGLRRYRRDRVDGLWLTRRDISKVTEGLRAKTVEERGRIGCIGRDRADLVVCGCAILEALLEVWPVEKVRVADRGLREGILAELARDAERLNQA